LEILELPGTSKRFPVMSLKFVKNSVSKAVNN